MRGRSAFPGPRNQRRVDSIQHAIPVWQTYFVHGYACLMDPARHVRALETLTGDEIMTRNPTVAQPELLAYDALRLMEDRPSQISVLPVVDENRVCVGLVRLHDIVRSGL